MFLICSFYRINQDFNKYISKINRDDFKINFSARYAFVMFLSSKINFNKSFITNSKQPRHSWATRTRSTVWPWTVQGPSLYRVRQKKCWGFGTPGLVRSWWSWKATQTTSRQSWSIEMELRLKSASKWHFYFQWKYIILGILMVSM